MVAAGAEHSAAVTEDGHLFGWGWGRYGNLGFGDRNDRLVPEKVSSYDVCNCFSFHWNSKFNIKLQFIAFQINHLSWVPIIVASKHFFFFLFADPQKISFKPLILGAKFFENWQILEWLSNMISLYKFFINCVFVL